MAEQKVQESKEQKDNFKYFVRIANTDLDGNKAIGNALKKIKGVSFMFSNLICNIAGV
ncbi:30S ribosomal protein S13, partial [Candidatus Woesearchaeota archaeon]|nr:30S ribosomal protein S13 [Candidatus Woesearchaeota archaeon]